MPRFTICIVADQVAETAGDAAEDFVSEIRTASEEGWVSVTVYTFDPETGDPVAQAIHDLPEHRVQQFEL